MSRKSVLPAVAMVLLVASVALADTYVVKKVETEGTGQSGSEEIEIWIGEDRISQTSGSNSYIARYDKNQLLVLDRDSKKYSVLDLPIEFEKLVPPEMAGQLAQMKDMMQMTVAVTSSDETKKVGEWNARRYNAKLTNAMGVEIDIAMWNTTEIEVDIAPIKRMVESLASMQPGGDWMKDLTSIEGFTVLQEVEISMMGQPMKTREQVVSVETKDAPPGVYDPPADFVEAPFNLMEAMAGGN